MRIKSSSNTNRTNHGGFIVIVVVPFYCYSWLLYSVEVILVTRFSMVNNSD